MIRATLAAAALAAASPLAAAVAPDLAIKFGERESFFGAALSPDGGKVSYITPITGRGSAVMIANTTTGEVKPIFSTGDPRVTIGGCFWAKIDRIICRLRTVSDALGSDLIGVSRLFSVSPDEKEVKEIGRKLGDRSLGINQNSGSVINILPDAPDDVLMAVWNEDKETIGSNIRAKPRGLAGQRVNIRTGRMQMVEQPVKDGAELFADPTGAIRVKGVQEMKEVAIDEDSIGNRRIMGNNYRYAYRTKTSRDWRPLATTDIRDTLTTNVLGFDQSGDGIYMQKANNGRYAIFLHSTDGSDSEKLLFARPDVDVDGIYRIGKDDRPIGFSYTTDSEHVDYFDPALTALAARLTKALPGHPNVQIISETWDGSKLFIYAGSDVDPGAYYIYDKTAKRLGKLSSARPKLEGLQLATQKPITYNARDGVQVPAYLTLPPGKENAKNLPLIVMPHGGPSARDSWGFDWLPQYFAQLGYAVVQPNYRGSAGYGEAWYKDNGFKGWRTAIGDVNDSAKWLVKQGIADPRRMAIFGWSYGGYAALQSSALDSGLFKAIIAVAPVTDLQRLMDDARNFTNYRLVADFVGGGPHVVEGSPVKNVRAIQAPVLMFHGTKDINVDISQSRAMESALKAAGKPVELVVYPDLEHSLVDDRVRADLLLKSARFLETNLR